MSPLIAFDIVLVVVVLLFVVLALLRLPEPPVRKPRAIMGEDTPYRRRAVGAPERSVLDEQIEALQRELDNDAVEKGIFSRDTGVPTYFFHKDTPDSLRKAYLRRQMREGSR